MDKRPDLSTQLDGQTFRSYYYLKEELTGFCRANGLPVSGGKLELTDRIAYFLDTGEIQAVKRKGRKSAGLPQQAGDLTEETRIEPDFVCSEKHRAFFKERIGKSFSFNVAFQKWLKTIREKPMQRQSKHMAGYWRRRRTKKRTLISSLNIIHTSGIFLPITPADHWRRLSGAGNIRRASKGITVMKEAI